MSFEIRDQQPGDLPSIRQVHLAAFAGPGEARLVEMLLASDHAVISLVAVHQGQVIGHILFSPVTFDPPRPPIRALGLAPLAVLPDHQNRGAGSHLIRAGLAQSGQKGIQAVIVLGHPNYYSRFGFRRAADYGLGNEYGADEAFMALELSAGALEQINATARYAPEFALADI